MKCSQCGHTMFLEVYLHLSVEDSDESVQAYSCLSCGHIELYMPGSRVSEISKNIERKKELKKSNEELKK